MRVILNFFTVVKILDLVNANHTFHGDAVSMSVTPEKFFVAVICKHQKMYKYIPTTPVFPNEMV